MRVFGFGRAKDENEAINVEVNHVANGDLVEDLVTGFQGVVTATTTWLHGCDRIEVTPNSLSDDGQPLKTHGFDIMRCKLLTKSVLPAIQPDPAEIARIALGSTAKDTLTGFEGMITGRATFATGFVEVFMEAEELDEKGKPKDMQVFNSSRIKVIENKPIPVAEGAPKAKTGGPQRGEGMRANNSR